MPTDEPAVSPATDQQPLWLLSVQFVGGFLLFPLGITAWMFWWVGRLGAEKTLTQFALPDGLFWCLLTASCIVSWRRHRAAAAGWTLLWLLFTVAGNPILVDQLCAVTESAYLDSDPFAGEPFDAVVVLGGGTRYAPNGTSQLAASGDRVMLGARLYFAGQTPQLICSGEPIAGFSNPEHPTPAEQTRQIWEDLQIPQEAIILIRGRNTSEEIQATRQLFPASNQRIGLLTSAWHLPRAMRLAKAHGLNATGLPADFISNEAPFTPLRLVPTAGSLASLSRISKEWLARLVGR